MSHNHRPPTTIPFMKLHGCGNSFVVLAEDQAANIDWPALTRRACRADLGVGSDGLLAVRRGEESDFEVRMLNPDGSSMGMCGNGIRCVCRFIILSGLAPTSRRQLSFIVEGRPIVCELIDEARRVRVNMGPPSFTPADVPVLAETELVNAALRVGEEEFRVTALSMGNPHCVVFVSDLDQVDLAALGPRFERHTSFPRRTNAEFVKVVRKDRLQVKVWERGAGATMACGTGACASVVAGVRLGRCEPRAVVELPGGELLIEWDQQAGQVYLTGPAEEICRGTLAASLIPGAAADGL